SAAGMRPARAALAESAAAAMGRAAADRIRQPERRCVRAGLADRRAAAADAGISGPQTLAAGRHAPPPGLAFGKPDDKLQRGIPVTTGDYWIIRLQGCQCPVTPAGPFTTIYRGPPLQFLRRII